MIKKKLFLKTSIGLLVIIAFGINIYPLIWCNGSGGVYSSVSGTDEAGSGYTNPIEAYIVKGAGYYLAANAYVQELLRQVELQDDRGIDFIEMQMLVKQALYNVNMAKAAYERLIKLAETIPYNENYLQILRDFDYDTFTTQNHLNATIMNNARFYLQNGDITGIFKNSYSRFQAIIKLLNAIKSDCAQGKLSSLSFFWSLNDAMAEQSAFGSCIARLFASIK